MSAMNKYINLGVIGHNGGGLEENGGAIRKRRQVRDLSPMDDNDGVQRAKALTDVSDSSLTNVAPESSRKEGYKWHSVWELRSTDKEKNKEKKKKNKHRTHTQIAQGLKDVLNLGQEPTANPNAEDDVPPPLPKREKPKRPPPPVIMSEIRDSLHLGLPPNDQLETLGVELPRTPLTEPARPPKSNLINNSAEVQPRFTKNPSAGSRVPKSIPEIPKLPKGKKVMETVIQKDVDSLFRSIFENETFFEIVTKKTYDDVRNFFVAPWTMSNASERRRKMSYEFPKTIAFSRHEIRIEQVQTQANYSQPGRIYAVDSVTQNSGVMYSDYFEVHIHFRLTSEEDNRSTRVVVVGDLVFVKPCLFKGRIETESWSGLKKYYEMVEREMQLEKKTTSQPLSTTDSVDTTGIQGRPPLPKKSKLLGQNVNAKNSTGHKTEGSFIMGEQTLSFAFLLVILTLMIITLALFKLAGAIAALSDRLGSIEDLLERYALICLDPNSKFKHPTQS